MKEELLSECCGSKPTEMMACSDCGEIDTAFRVIPLDANDMPNTVRFMDGSEMAIDRGILTDCLTAHCDKAFGHVDPHTLQDDPLATTVAAVFVGGCAVGFWVAMAMGAK